MPGDIRDLAIEATHYLKDEEVDKLLVALFAIGVATSAGTLFSGGIAAVVKSGISLLKVAHKSKYIPSWMSRLILQKSKEIPRKNALLALKALFLSLESLRRQLGVSQTLRVLSHTASLKGLQSLTGLSKRYGTHTATLPALSKNRLLQQAKRFQNMDTRTIKEASGYGESGFIYLLKNGEKKFLKTTKRLKAYAKIGHTGKVWQLVLSLMNALSNLLLSFIVLFSSLLLLPWRFLKILL